jgi:hypothetical protein
MVVRKPRAAIFERVLETIITAQSPDPVLSGHRSRERLGNSPTEPAAPKAAIVKEAMTTGPARRNWETHLS